MSTLAVSSRNVGLGKTLAELAKSFKQTFSDEDKAISDAKYEYQLRRIDILHEVLRLNNGDRKATKQWAVKNGPVGERQVQALLQGEEQAYGPFQADDSKPVSKRAALRTRRARQSIATKGLRPTIYPSANKEEREFVEREVEAQRKAEESEELVFDLGTRRKFAIDMLNVGHKVLSTKHHPDKGGSADVQRILNDAATWARQIIQGAI